MNLEEKLRALKKAAARPARDTELDRQLDYLRRLAEPPRPLPAQRVPRGIEEYVEGRVEENSHGEYFCAHQALPFGRPYGKWRIGDLACADLAPLKLFLAEEPVPAASEVVYLDTETTGLAGGTGTCAFLIGLGAVEGSRFVVRQFFLRDYPEEKAMLSALAEALRPYRALVTFNGKVFDVPLLETRFALARMKAPFRRLLHLDLLHPARGLWKLRLESCQLARLEKEVLGVAREGDVSGAEIPGIYFDYLRVGDARGLQPVFYHNALDIISLAVLTAELARVVADEGARTLGSSVDLFSLSRIFQRAGAAEKSLAVCRRALNGGLPESIETRALWQLAAQHKRRREYDPAVRLWLELARREPPFALQALVELAIHYEHRRRDPRAALAYAQSALERLDGAPHAKTLAASLSHRRERLRRKSLRTNSFLAPAP
jgi:uncharacterized protein